MHAFRCYIFAARIACDSGPTCLFQPVALETLGPIIDSAVDFLSELGSRIGTASLPEAFRDDTAF